MELKDTIEMMTSSDYKERFKAEYHQLMIRYRKLRDMVKRWDEGTLDFKPTCPRTVYDRQIMAMFDYINVLKYRAELENIDLSVEA